MPMTSPTLPIHIRPGNLQASPAIEAWVHHKLAGVFRRYGSKLTAIEVHFEDVNGPKRGAADARCLMEARVNGRQPIAVQARADDLYAAIDGAARKLDAAIARCVERTDSRARRRFRQEPIAWKPCMLALTPLHLQQFATASGRAHAFSQ